MAYEHTKNRRQKKYFKMVNKYKSTNLSAFYFEKKNVSNNLLDIE